MSKISEEKDLVFSLRQNGFTLQEIAQKLNKSIFWVKSRLDKKYEPQKERKTAKEDIDPKPHEIIDPKLSAEVDQVKKMRESGLTYEQIATQLNRSIYWVHTRLRLKYTPRVSLNEKKFQESRVILWLKEQGHKIVGQYVRSGTGLFTQEADIVSFFNGFMVITEVKVSITHHQLQTAIGQLLIHKYSYEDDSKIKLQIALPIEVFDKEIHNDLFGFLENRIGIKICLIT